MEDFDPYYIWLGIPPEEQPADHYRLLGLRRFEQNDDVIANAAEGKMAYLRTLQVGKRSKQSQALLNEIAAAQVCLLNAETKAAYDAKLGASSARTTTHLPPQSVVPLAPVTTIAPATLTPLAQPPLTPLRSPLVVSAPLVPVDPRSLHYAAPPEREWPTGDSDGPWERLQSRLETLPKAAVIALAAGPVVVSLLILLIVMAGTSSDRPPQRAAGLATAASFDNQPPRIVPPAPIPPAPRIVQSPAVAPVAPAFSAPRGAATGIAPRLSIHAAGSDIHRTLLSARGDYLAVDATQSGKRNVQVFETQTGRKLMAIDTPSPTGRLALADDLILIVSEPTGITAFDTLSGRLRTLSHMPGRIRDVALSQDRLSAFVLTDDSLLVLDTQEFRQKTNLKVGGGPHQLQTLQCSGKVVMASGRITLEVFDIASQRQITSAGFNSDVVWRAFLTDDFSYYRIFQADGAVRYERQGFQGRGRLAAAELPGAPRVDRIIEGVQGGNRIAWLAPNQGLVLFDLVTSRPTAHIIGSNSGFSGMAMSADGEWMAARDGDGPLVVVSVRSLPSPPTPFPWPNRLDGGSPRSVATASITGPAIKNVGVASVAGGG